MKHSFLSFYKYKDMDGIYFEIWKRVAKLKVSMSVSTTKYDVFFFRFFIVIGYSLILVLHMLNSLNFFLFMLCVSWLITCTFILNFFQKDFREALLEIYIEKMFPFRALEIEYELDDKKVRIFYMKDDVSSSSQFYYSAVPIHLYNSFVCFFSSMMHSWLISIKWWALYSIFKLVSLGQQVWFI